MPSFDPLAALPGYLEGQQARLGQQLTSLEIGKEGVELERAKMLLNQQKQFADAIAKMNSGPMAPGADTTSQASQLAAKLYTLSDAATKSGLVEEAATLSEHAQRLQSGDMAIKEATARMRLSTATLISNLVKDLKPGDTEEFHKRILLGQAITGQSADPKLSQQEFTKELKERLLAQAETQQQEATRQLEEQRLEKEKQDTELAKTTGRLREKQIDFTQARTDYYRKGGAGSKLAKESAEAKETALGDIDELRAMIADDPNVVGFTGTLKQWAEFGKTKLGVGDQSTPATRFATRLQGMLTVLPKAFQQSGSRQLKIVHERIEEMANLLRRGTSADTANAKLDELEAMLKGESSRTGGRSGEIERPAVAYKSADQVKKDFEAGNLDQDEAIDILVEQFGMEDPRGK